LEHDLIVVREAKLTDAEAMARIQVAGWTKAYASFIPDRIPASYSVDVRRSEWQKRLAEPAPATVNLVAVEGARILGICGGGPPLRDETITEGDTDAYTAQVYGLYVAPDHYGRGIGRLLLGRLAARLAASGHRNLCLWAFELNAYRGFYDRLGGKAEARAVWHVGDTVIREMAYGWADIDSLVEACLEGAKTE
jgi:GNAT superfamily N-acetyltransferase